MFSITTDTILRVVEYHFKHRETEDYKIFRVKYPCETKKITFDTILGSHIEIPFFMQQQGYAIIINDCGILKMKIPRSVIYHYWNQLSYLKENTINIIVNNT